MRSPPSVATGLFAGRYAIEREIGQGASAIVYLARDTQAGTAVALKILRPELAESRASDRFLREIKRTSALQHPHILPVLEAGDHEGHLYFALPYMEGGSLRQLLQREKHLEMSRVLEIAKTVAEALDYAHERGLIHRDVKPENILFTNGVACLGDFGIARAIDLSGTGGTGTTSRSMVRGTPAYMSPEQAAGSEDLDGRSDVFSLACVIYEMITGMQAYIGPTDEAVIAQRFLHPPRDLRVYRPTATDGLANAVHRAFATVPADRYRTASEMVAAIARTVAESATHTRRGRMLGKAAFRTRWWQTAAVILLVAAAAIVKVIDVPAVTGRDEVPELDTLRVVVLPLERDPAIPDAAWRHDDLLHEALARWRDIAVQDPFQVADALNRFGSVTSNRDAAMLARSLGAGRFIRAKITTRGDGWHVAASLYDADASASLYQASQVIPRDLASASAAFARLADALLLRGATVDSNSRAVPPARSLPAVQSYGRAQTALAKWDLQAADSALFIAADLDADYARANLWLAQVRAWQHRLPSTWGTFAERAERNASQLDEREALLARALVLLSRGTFDSACAVYEGLARRNARDFAAWFGIGQCHSLNRSVIADRSSPSGWRFKSSAQRGMSAYAKAFEVLPSVFRGYERGAFQRLRELLLLSNFRTIGFGDGDSALFYARPGWRGDSLVLLPYPAALFASAPAPAGMAEAIQRRRAEFRRLAAIWSTAFPSSSGAKHAVAISLQLIGDPVAIDSIRAARHVADGEAARIELAASEVLMLASFGINGRANLLRASRALSDTLLSMRDRADIAPPRFLVPLAILTGRCQLAMALLQATNTDGRPRAAPADLFTASNKLAVGEALGCPLDLAVPVLAAEINQRARATSTDLGLLDGLLLLRPTLLSSILDTTILRRLDSTSRHPLARAALLAARGHYEEMRRILVADREGWGRRVPTADFGYARARILLMARDSLAAARELEDLLRGTQFFEPNELQEPGRTAGLIAALRLRIELARAMDDENARARWSAVIAELWKDADTPPKTNPRRRVTDDTE